MDVSNVAATSVSTIVNSPQSPQTAQQTAPKNEKQPENQKDSTVVKLSAQARQLNRTENHNTERAEAKQKEAAPPPGLQVVQGESKGGHVNTFA